MVLRGSRDRLLTQLACLAQIVMAPVPCARGSVPCWTDPHSASLSSADPRVTRSLFGHIMVGSSDRPATQQALMRSGPCGTGSSRGPCSWSRSRPAPPAGRLRVQLQPSCQKQTLMRPDGNHIGPPPTRRFSCKRVFGGPGHLVDCCRTGPSQCPTLASA
eukprot:363973-Chlamydomonas_euryale.AAC.9